MSSLASTSHLPCRALSSFIFIIVTANINSNLLNAYPDKLIIVKFFATYCKACRSLEPKLTKVRQDPQLDDLPIVWAELAIAGWNKDFFQKTLRVLTLPTIHFYDGSRGLIENFPCGPAKIPLLKKKLARFINKRVDPQSRQLLPPAPTQRTPAHVGLLMVPRVIRSISESEDLIDEHHIKYLRSELPFFRNLDEYEFQYMMSRAKLLTFDAGDIIIRQGMPGDTFYVIKRGVAEMSVLSRADKNSSASDDYLGVVINELGPLDYFGERALTTGEPYAASVRVLDKVRCFAFDAEIIPETSILSRKRRATQEMVEQLNQRYIVPKALKGSNTTNAEEKAAAEYPVSQNDENVLELLVRFKQIRQAAKCFEYILQSRPNWGNYGDIARRTMLVRKLTASQRDEFNSIFDMVDSQKRGKITLEEMKKFKDSAQRGKSATTEGFQDFVGALGTSTTSSESIESSLDNVMIGLDEFLGLMAEAEFYNLFFDTFQVLDVNNTGYVRAGDLQDVLGSVRDLVDGDFSSKNLNVQEQDSDVLVDYQQFSRMLLGAAL